MKKNLKATILNKEDTMVIKYTEVRYMDALKTFSIYIKYELILKIWPQYR
jgi:hypothetical protein